MKTHSILGIFLLLLPGALLTNCRAQPARPGSGPDTPPSYRRSILEKMLAEANEYATCLHLPETLPIREASLKEIYVSPPEFAARFGGLGSFKTARFSYAFGKGRRLCYITRCESGSTNSVFEAHKHLAIAESQVNTNAAFMMATQQLAAAFVDVGALSRAGQMSAYPWRILDIVTSKYTVEWRAGAKRLAEVTLVLPTSELYSLRVEDPDLIRRPPLNLSPK